jgi:hypothetical protein
MEGKMAKIKVVTGLEGSKHDPDCYTEITLTKANGDVIIGHIGFTCWVTVNGEKQLLIPRSGDEDGMMFEAAAKKWLQLTGIKWFKARELPHRILHSTVRVLPKKEQVRFWELIHADQALRAQAY